MVDVSPVQGGPPSVSSPPDAAQIAARILAGQGGGANRDFGAIRRELDALAARDSDLGAAVGRELNARLSPVEQGELARAGYEVTAPDGGAIRFRSDAPSVADYRAMPAGSDGRAFHDRLDRIWGDGNPATDDTGRIETGLRELRASGLSLAQYEAMRASAGAAPPAAAPSTPSTATLVADLGQMALDITGIVDPTPISDGGNALISLGRAVGSAVSGEWGQAGGHLVNGAISAVAIVPALGDAAKLGKIAKWAQTVSDAVGAVARNPAAREALEPVLRQIHDAVKAIPQGAIDALPASARESLERMKTQLNEFFGVVASSLDRLVQRYPILARADDVVVTTAEAANENFVQKGWNPPYAAGTEVAEFVTAEPARFVRVHGPDNKARSWMMNASDIHGLTAAQIKDRFALPDLPTFVSDVAVPAGTRVRVGEVASQPGWGSGGATQFELLERLPEAAFQNTRGLP